MQWPKGWIKASRLSIFFLKTRQIILLWKRPFIPEILKQSKDKYIDKDEDKDKEEERLEFYSRLANCWWVGGGQKSDLRRPVDPALHYWLHPPHTHYNTEHKTNFTLNKAIHNLHTEHRTEHIAAHFSTVVGGKPGPRDRSRLSTIFIQTHFILLLALTSNFESIPANCFWSKKRERSDKTKVLVWWSFAADNNSSSSLCEFVQEALVALHSTPQTDRQHQSWEHKLRKYWKHKKPVFWHQHNFQYFHQTKLFYRGFLF